MYRVPGTYLHDPKEPPQRRRSARTSQVLPSLPVAPGTQGDTLELNGTNTTTSRTWRSNSGGCFTGRHPAAARPREPAAAGSGPCRSSRSPDCPTPPPKSVRVSFPPPATLCRGYHRRAPESHLAHDGRNAVPHHRRRLRCRYGRPSPRRNRPSFRLDHRTDVLLRHEQ